MTAQQGGAPQMMSISAVLSGQVTSTLAVSFTDLPPGVTVWPNQPTTFAVNQGTTQYYFLSATSAATPGQVTVNISGTLGSVSHSYTFPVTITAAAPFQLSLSPTQLSLTPGVPRSVQVTVVPTSGPVPDVDLVTSTLPGRTDFSSPVITGAQPGPYTLTFDATIASQPLSNFPIFITAETNAGDTSTVELLVSLTVPFPPIAAPTRSTVVRTDDNPTGLVYDAARKLVFAALPNLNEVRVFSSTDSRLVATIPTIHPGSIDESADGSRVFVGSFGLITTIDPESLEVVRSNPIPTPSGLITSSPAQVVALSTGNALVLSGTQLYLWNPATAVTTPLDPQGVNVVSLIRSADRTVVLLQGISGASTSAVIYDAPSGIFGATLQGITVGNAQASAALNPNGSQIAFITPGSSDETGFLDFYDGQFNLLNSQPLYNQDSAGQLIYSLDGNTLYAFFWQPVSTEVGAAFNAATFAPEGLFSMAPQIPTTPYAIDETGMIFGPGNGVPYGSLAFTDASHPGAMIPDPSLEVQNPPTLPGGACPVAPSTNGGSPFPPAPVLNFPNVLCGPSLLNGAGFDSNVQYSLFVGPPPASPASESATDVSVVSFSELGFSLPATPPNNAPGPVNLTLTRPDGWYQVIPDGYSYGPTSLFADPLAVPPAGQTTINILGYSLDGSNTTVTIGGKPATVLSSGPYNDNVAGLFPLQELQVTAPAGMAGPADITITTGTGSATLSGFQYLNSAQVFPITGTLGSVAYDQPRQRLYISNTGNNRVEIFNLSTQALLSPISVGNAPTNLSLSPDGTRLAVLNSTDGTISAIDPAQMKVLGTYPGYTPQDQTSCGGTPLGSSAATIAPHRELIALGCPFVVHVLNLDTGAISCSGITGCDSTGTILNPGFPPVLPPAVVAAVASSADGTKAVMTTGFSQVSLLDLTKNNLAVSVGMESQGENAAIDADDNLFAANLAIYNAGAAPVNLANGVGYFNFELEGELGGGEAFNPSGSLLFLPSSGVDIFDVHQGRLALRIALPEAPTVSVPPKLAVDETGTKVFVLTRSGLTIAQLAVVPLSISSVNPTSGASGATVTIRGSGFQSGATVLFGTTSATTTYVDGMTLKATVPNLSSGPVRVTVTNPGGQQYFFDAAFTVN
jgi:WD40 repeat protein